MPPNHSLQPTATSLRSARLWVMRKLLSRRLLCYAPLQRLNRAAIEE